ncbi:MAG: (2Fe-2S)-binding protein [Phycisphaerales bacterium]|nr:(2Fe-2S)-binding protein [Phycisphaerales bacterium]
MDRCLCAGVTFAEFKRRADRTGATMDELQRATGCGRGCGLCRPYLVLALRTGRTRLPVLSPAQFSDLGVSP